MRVIVLKGIFATAIFLTISFSVYYVLVQSSTPQFEEVTSLDVYGLKKGFYTVDVNGVTDIFELQIDNIPKSSD